jgi:anti-sigma regulatory factor (Ser/Thr protein kinase)
MTADLDIYGAACADQHEPGDPALRHRIELPAGNAAAGLARQTARQVLTSWGLDEAAETAVLLACELVTNAVRHVHAEEFPRAAVQEKERAAGPELQLTVSPGLLRIEVFDTDPRPPQPRTPDELDESGFGFVLVGALADGWGTYLTATGKAVWADVPIRRSSEQSRTCAEAGERRSLDPGAGGTTVNAAAASPASRTRRQRPDTAMFAQVRGEHRGRDDQMGKAGRDGPPSSYDRGVSCHPVRLRHVGAWT